MKRDPLLKHDSSFVDLAPAVARVLTTPADWRYAAPRWLPTRHAQTIVPALFGRKPDVAYQRERWNTPDGDFIDLDWLVHDATGPQPGASAPLSCCSTASKATRIPTTPAR